MKKLTLLAAAGAGYVLGTKAGRRRYEQIKSHAATVWKNPRVQKTVSDVEDKVKEAASDVGGKAAHAASHAASSLVDAARPSKDDDAPPAPPTYPAP